MTPAQLDALISEDPLFERADAPAPPTTQRIEDLLAQGLVG